MKAVLFHTHGGPEVLEYTDFPTPEPAEGQVLVKLEAAALNRVDIWTRDGWPGIKLQYPHILGADGAGTMAGVGACVTDWKIGDRVVINSNLVVVTARPALLGRIIVAVSGIYWVRRFVGHMRNI